MTAIGTDSGKTLVSAILVEALGADYWKPVQAGIPVDTQTVKALVTNSQSQFHKERYALREPMSPHAAAEREGINMKLEDFTAPPCEKDLIIEGAGGVMVPINEEEVIIDLVPRLEAEIILVSNLYLGSINHTLLSIELIKQRGYAVKGIIFNGPSNPDSESVILAKSGWPCLLRIPQHDDINPTIVQQYAKRISID